ncbi:MAG: hypothetical protein ACM31C_18770 [Acidobacteriota bacterium]
MARGAVAGCALALACASCGRLGFDVVPCVGASCDEGGSGGPLDSGLTAPVVLFQPDFTSSAANAGAPSVVRGGVSNVYSIGAYYDPTAARVKFFVNDRDNNRVMIYEHVPTASGALPDHVIGQTAWTDGLANAGQPAPDARTLSDNVDVTVCATGEMFVADASNNRVLAWRSVPATDDTPADFVLGQPDFTSNAAGTSATRMNRPYAAHCIEGQLFVPERENHRILVYDPLPASGDAQPRFAIGQPDLVTGTPSCSPLGLTNPYEVLHHAGYFFIADGGNHRVLVFDDALAAGPAMPIAVLGQRDFTSCQPNRGAAAPDATTLSFPNGLAARGDTLFVSDHDNRRVLLYRLPVATGDAAYAVLGQPSFTTAAQQLPPDATSLGYTKGLVVDGNYLWIGDGGNNRVIAMPLP